MNIYDFKVKNTFGDEVSLDLYKGKVLLIVNTASKCGFTPQFKELEEIYKELGNEQFEILAFPCNQFKAQDPGTNEEIVNFCKLNYGVSFPVFSKIDVNGPNADPLYKYLTSEKKGFLGDNIKWNFTKFLVDSEGNVVERFAPIITPLNIKEKIVELIKVIK